jgi:non-heme Fe2+,alpha-ketoglutarate-dependent halogenase
MADRSMLDHIVWAEEQQKYQEDGFIGPLKAFEPSELAGIGERVVKELEAKDYSLASKRNRHLDWDLAKHLATPPAIIEAVTRLLGPDLVLWRTNFFTGMPGRGVRWHQDEYRTLLAAPANQISLHLGITAAPPENCVMVIPGSHRLSRDELHRRGFNFMQGTDEDGYGAPNFWRSPASPNHPVKMVLKPGEFFAFHPLLMHGSLDATRPPEAEPPREGILQRLGKRLASLGTKPVPPRVGMGLRVTVPGNDVLPAAFAETLPRPDRCIAFAG